MSIPESTFAPPASLQELFDRVSIFDVFPELAAETEGKDASALIGEFVNSHAEDLARADNFADAVHKSLHSFRLLFAAQHLLKNPS